ncbi:uncharacterized protein LOC103939967 isoform X8 [Pyrus x bretschneideri]|uniref:uncharacterized protein LOC103939967 isoform X8 n=1 Tax=Pyrus x bretschneideri TaxID=225117 RepID=UPI00202E9AFC|nr:uncharacterized protein LOC103939967 isoform X8 [Pyrus x bretschneideri]
MLFLLKTCHKFKTRRDLESKTEQLLHSEMTPTSQQTQLLQFQLQFLKKELGISFSHNMDDESTWKSTTNITSKKLYSQLSKTLWNLLQQKVKFSFLGNSSS